jgi:hypothetical protein
MNKTKQPHPRRVVHRIGIRMKSLNKSIAALLIVLFGFTACEASDIETYARNDKGFCVLYSKGGKIPYLRRIDRDLPASPSNLYVKGKIDQGPITMPKEACDKFRDPSETLVTDGGVLWFYKSDFVHEDDLKRITHWKTRYWYANMTADNRGAELSSAIEELRLNSASEIDVYQATRVRDKIHLFSPDGRYYDAANKRWWDLYLSPLGGLVLKDATGKYLPTGIDDLPVELEFYCDPPQDDDTACGFRMDPKWVASSTPAHLINSPPSFKPVRVEPDKIVLTQRLSTFSYVPSKGGGDDIDNYVFLADFDDPIRPVVFAPGVLFNPKAKPNPKGKYRPQDLYDKEVCIADCPDQLELQGIINSAPQEQAP